MKNLMMLLPYIVLIVAFYFLLIRPQQKKEKTVKSMRDNLQEGDQIVTIGGFYATITAVKDDWVFIEAGPDKLKLKLAKWAVGKVVNDGE